MKFSKKYNIEIKNCIFTCHLFLEVLQKFYHTKVKQFMIKLQTKRVLTIYVLNNDTFLKNVLFQIGEVKCSKVLNKNSLFFQIANIA